MEENPEVAMQPQEVPVDAAAPIESDEGKDEGVLMEEALMHMYGDAETFSALLKMIEAHKGENISKGIAAATISIIGKLEKDNGPVDTGKLQQVGAGLVTAMYDLASKAGIVEEAGEQEISKAYALTVNMWMEQNPDRADPELYAQETQKIQQSGVQPMQPQDPMQQPMPEQGGLLGGAA